MNISEDPQLCQTKAISCRLNTFARDLVRVLWMGLWASLTTAEDLKCQTLVFSELSCIATTNIYDHCTFVIETERLVDNIHEACFTVSVWRLRVASQIPQSKGTIPWARNDKVYKECELLEQEFITSFADSIVLNWIDSLVQPLNIRNTNQDLKSDMTVTLHSRCVLTRHQCIFCPPHSIS
jgi:hypothetical protein